jgi:hypothetical protein
MKKIIAITTLVAATSASAFFGNNNNNGWTNGNGMSNWVEGKDLQFHIKKFYKKNL